MEKLDMELLILDDIKYQLERARAQLLHESKEAAHYRLERAHEYCMNLAVRLADAIEETS